MKVLVDAEQNSSWAQPVFCLGTGGDEAIHTILDLMYAKATAPVVIPITTSVMAGSNVTYTVTTNPTQGTMTNFNTSTGDFTYTPSTDALQKAEAAGMDGSDTFTVTATNGVHTGTETINVPVSSVDPIVGNWDVTAASDVILDGQPVSVGAIPPGRRRLVDRDPRRIYRDRYRWCGERSPRNW